jgi:uncharacterized protein
MMCWLPVRGKTARHKGAGDFRKARRPRQGGFARRLPASVLVCEVMLGNIMLANIEPMPPTLDDLRRFAVAHSLFPPTTLRRALHKFGFVQADPIRAPARAQDLILRHRVKGYRAGDLERRYSQVGIEEDFFINYGFVTRELQSLMHPRSNSVVTAQSRLWWPAGRRKRAELLLAFVRERGVVHPREVDRHFAHGSVENYWGGSSNATTRLLDAMHYQGLLRIVRRQAGIRIYAAHEHESLPFDRPERHRRIDALVDVAVRIYAPLPAKSLSLLVRRLRYAAPQWQGEIAKALKRAQERLAHARVEGVEWYWPGDENPSRSKAPEGLRLLAPFDPVVWDRWRFELLWGWMYRFEAYTPVAKRQRGYYALPLLWRDRVIGWGNLAVKSGGLHAEFGFVGQRPVDRAFEQELVVELDRVRHFLGLRS